MIYKNDIYETSDGLTNLHSALQEVYGEGVELNEVMSSYESDIGRQLIGKLKINGFKFGDKLKKGHDGYLNTSEHFSMSKNVRSVEDATNSLKGPLKTLIQAILNSSAFSDTLGDLGVDFVNEPSVNGYVRTYINAIINSSDHSVERIVYGAGGAWINFNFSFHGNGINVFYQTSLGAETYAANSEHETNKGWARVARKEQY